MKNAQGSVSSDSARHARRIALDRSVIDGPAGPVVRVGPGVPA